MHVPIHLFKVCLKFAPYFRIDALNRAWPPKVISSRECSWRSSMGSLSPRMSGLGKTWEKWSSLVFCNDMPVTSQKHAKGLHIRYFHNVKELNRFLLTLPVRVRKDSYVLNLRSYAPCSSASFSEHVPFSVQRPVADSLPFSLHVPFSKPVPFCIFWVEWWVLRTGDHTPHFSSGDKRLK